MTHFSKIAKTSITVGVLSTFFLALLALTWVVFLKSPVELLSSPVLFGWIYFAFVSGLFMVGTRSIYPFALTLAPKTADSTGKGSVIRACAFSLSTLVLFGALGWIFALIGGVSSILGHSTNFITAYAYFGFGVLAYVIALRELGFISLDKVVILKHIPQILRKLKGPFGAFVFGALLSLFDILPSTWMLFGDVALRRSVAYGVILLLTHALGRVLPLLVLATLARFGVNGTHWVADRREKLARASSVVSLVAASVLIYFGLKLFIPIASSSIGLAVESSWGGGWVLLALWMLPLWIYFFKEQSRVYGNPENDLRILTQKIKEAEEESAHLEGVRQFHEPNIRNRIIQLTDQLETLQKKCALLESSLRHNATHALRGREAQRSEEKALILRFAFTISLTLLVMSMLSAYIF